MKQRVNNKGGNEAKHRQQGTRNRAKRTTWQSTRMEGEREMVISSIVAQLIQGPADYIR